MLLDKIKPYKSSNSSFKNYRIIVIKRVVITILVLLVIRILSLLSSLLRSSCRFKGPAFTIPN